MKILKINASVKNEGSSSRQLVDELALHLSDGQTAIVNRDLALGVPLLTEDMVNAFYTPSEKRTEDQQKLLSFSDTLVKELEESDLIILGFPMYNFSVPASVKAYFDLIARVGVTFSYSEKGPEGLLKDKTAYVVMATGGTAFKSDIDFASDYVKHFLGFIGITDVRFIPADQLMFNAERSLQKAREAIERTTMVLN